jgi:hypothetical protein
MAISRLSDAFWVVKMLDAEPPKLDLVQMGLEGVDSPDVDAPVDGDAITKQKRFERTMSDDPRHSVIARVNAELQSEFRSGKDDSQVRETRIQGVNRQQDLAMQEQLVAEAPFPPLTKLETALSPNGDSTGERQGIAAQVVKING